MHQTPVEPSGSQFADPFQFLDYGTVVASYPVSLCGEPGSSLASYPVSLVETGYEANKREAKYKQ